MSVAVAATAPALVVGGRGRALAPTVWLGLATVAALALALRMPVATTVLGLAVFGVLHNVLELRYVAGRFDAVLAGPFLGLLVILVTGIVICRLLPVSAGSRAAEIVICYAVLGAAWVRAWGASARPQPSAAWPSMAQPSAAQPSAARLSAARRRWWLAGGLLAILGAGAASITFSAYHFVILTHLHNIIPLVFLWDWSAAMASPRARRALRATSLAWVVLVPALLLFGVFDRLLRAAPAMLGGFGGVAAFEPRSLVAAYAWPGAASTELGLRFLAVFAFMQTMHYVVWVGVLPRYAPEVTSRFEARVPLLRGGRAWLLGVGLALVLGVLFAYDYANGRALYAAAASYHAYLEFPVLLALVVGLAGPHKQGVSA